MKVSRLGVFLMSAGALMIAAAFLLLWHNQRESDLAGQAAQKDLLALSEQMEVSQQVPVRTMALEAESPVSVLTVGEYSYLGVLAVPSLQLELPVMDCWDEERLRTAPCRHFGAPEQNNLVIAGHNYKTHFGLLDRLHVGELVSLTTVDNEEFLYTVEQTEVVGSEDVEQVRNSPWDLVLYTCTADGSHRLLVECMRYPVQEKSDI